MTAEKLRGAVHHEIRTELQRVGVNRGGEGVVYDHGRAYLVSRTRQPRQVHNLERRIGRTFQVEQAAAARDFGFNRLVVGRVAQGDLDVQARQELEKNLVGAAVGVFDRDDAVPGAQEGVEGIADGRHAGGKTGGGFGALKLAHLFLEGIDGGVGVAPVDVARFPAQRHVLPLVHVLVTKGDAVHHRHLGGALPEISLCFSSPNRQRPCLGPILAHPQPLRARPGHTASGVARPSFYYSYSMSE